MVESGVDPDDLPIAQRIHSAEIKVLTDDKIADAAIPAIVAGDPEPGQIDQPGGDTPPELKLDLEDFIQDMELGEIELIEEATGLTIAAILRQFETSDYSATVLIAIVWLALKRDDPEATMDTARKVKLTQIADVDDDDDETDPPL